jgi:AraC-like DNA-binding protein
MASISTRSRLVFTIQPDLELSPWTGQRCRDGSSAIWSASKVPGNGVPLNLIEVTVSGFTFFTPAPALLDIVETIWDVDVPDARSARAMTFIILPATSPTLCVHYRAAAGSNQRVNPGHCRQRVTGVQTGAIAVRPTGPMGAVIVHLKPEAAYRFIGGQMSAFTDANVGLSDLFGATEVSLLEEMLAEAADPGQRAKCVQAFLLSGLRPLTRDAVAHQAIVQMRRTPNLPVQRLAARLEISERQLSRRFNAMVGTSVKQFARVARFGKALAAHRSGRGWAEIAHACGFTDQAHMIHDFQCMAGRSPQALFRAAAQHRDLNVSLAMAGFYNTLVI